VSSRAPSTTVFLSLLLALSSLSGCSKLFTGTVTEKAAAPEQPKVLGGERVSRDGVVKSDAKNPKEAPVQLSVAQSFYVGDTLHIKVRVAAKTSLPTDRLVVGITALREGQIVETHYSRLLEETGQALLRSGESALIPFQLTSQDSSEYQIQCSWGEEAAALWSKVGGAAAQTGEAVAAASQAPDARAMAPISEAPTDLPLNAPDPVKPPLPGASGEEAAIEDVALDEQEDACAQPPCDRRYTLTARVVNHGASPITNVRLAVGFSWSESAQRPKSPPKGKEQQDGEELVDLGSKALQPGQGRKLRVKVARAVPVVPGGAFLPYIRLLDWKKAPVSG